MAGVQVRGGVFYLSVVVLNVYLWVTSALHLGDGKTLKEGSNPILISYINLNGNGQLLPSDGLFAFHLEETTPHTILLIQILYFYMYI